MNYKLSKQERPDHKSREYYDVVLSGHSLNGYQAVYVGLGRMEFSNGESKINVYEIKGREELWMEDCWNEFLNKVLF